MTTTTSTAAPVDARAAGARGDHTLPLAAGWRLWRLAVLRGAGFPAAMAAELSSPDLRAAALAVDAAGAAGEASGAAAIRQQREAEYAAAFGRDQHRVFGVLRAIAGQPRFREAVAWQNPGALATGVDKLARSSRAVPNSKARLRARLVARYLLRFCLKNDTVGFYGPMGWAEFTDGADVREARGERPAPNARDGLLVRPGPALVAARCVSFERWCVEAVADAIGASLTRELAGDLAGVASWALDLPPRRLPHLRVERDRVVATDTGRAESIPIEWARLLAACDGARTAAEIAALLADSPAGTSAETSSDSGADLGSGVASSGLATGVGPGLDNEPAVASALADLAARGWIAWGLQIPNFAPDPAHPYEASLRAQLERIRAPRPRARALATLDRMCDGKHALARAVGDEAVTRAMSSLERAFTEITGRAPTRRPGQLYAGRTLVYQDCTRDAQVELGPAIRTALAAPLSLLLASARWYTHTIATRCRDAFARIHAEMTGGTAAELALLPFADRAAQLLPTGAEMTGVSPIVAEVAAELRARWADILGLHASAGTRRLTVRAGDIASACAAAFDAPCPGWPSARYHSPDLLLAARDPAAVAAGEFTLVVGELHAGVNTVESLVVFSLRDDRATLARNLARDVTRPRIMRAVPGAQVDRAFILPLSDRDVEWTWETTPSWRERAIPAADLVVAPEPDGLVVRTRDHGRRWDVVEFFDVMLAYDAAGQFGVASGPRLPRIAIDDLVIQRETWEFDTASLPLRHDQDDRALFLAAQRWARAHELPRHVFYAWFDGDDRQKPMPLDLASPIGVRLFVNATRRSPRVVVSEMLPAPDELWLTDRDGAAYTSEIRVVALDPEPWRAPGELAAVGEHGAAVGDRSREGP